MNQHIASVTKLAMGRWLHVITLMYAPVLFCFYILNLYSCAFLILILHSGPTIWSNLCSIFCQCKIEWFHFGCVGVKERPKGAWYCSDCIGMQKRRKGKWLVTFVCQCVVLVQPWCGLWCNTSFLFSWTFLLDWWGGNELWDAGDLSSHHTHIHIRHLFETGFYH